MEIIIIEPVKLSRKPSARRQPSCSREPSRRLHPTPAQQIPASTVLLPVADQSSTSTSEDEAEVQHPALPVLQKNIIPALAMAAQRKFISRLLSVQNQERMLRIGSNATSLPVGIIIGTRPK